MCERFRGRREAKANLKKMVDGWEWAGKGKTKSNCKRCRRRKVTANYKKDKCRFVWQEKRKKLGHVNCVRDVRKGEMWRLTRGNGEVGKYGQMKLRHAVKVTCELQVEIEWRKNMNYKKAGVWTWTNQGVRTATSWLQCVKNFVSIILVPIE